MGFNSAFKGLIKQTIRNQVTLKVPVSWKEQLKINATAVQRVAVAGAIS